jgi:serine/threonine-protein kinase
LGFDEPPSEITYGRMIPIPNVVGFDLDRAVQALEAAGFTAASDNGVYSETSPANVVLEQSPKGSAYPGSTITLTVSLGPEPKPDPSPSPSPSPPPKLQPPPDPPDG